MQIQYLGLQDYLTTWEKMKAFTQERTPDIEDQIWILQHSPVFTQGQAGKPEHVLSHSDIPIVQTDRGGQITYHGPGQVVAYILLNLKKYNLTVRSLVCLLEQSVIELLHQYGIQATGSREAPGVYVPMNTQDELQQSCHLKDTKPIPTVFQTAARRSEIERAECTNTYMSTRNELQQSCRLKDTKPIPTVFQTAARRSEIERAECTNTYMSTRNELQQSCRLKDEGYTLGKKIASIGLRIKHGYSYHGLALNVDMDLQPFSLIRPCGLNNITITQIKDYVPSISIAKVESALGEILVKNFT